MIVCICRNISTHQFKTEKELEERVMQGDFKCGLCQLNYLNNKDNIDEQNHCTTN